MRRSAYLCLALLLLAPTLGCASMPWSKPAKVRFEKAPVPTDVDPWVNWPERPITSFEETKKLEGSDFVVVEEKRAGAGVTGAMEARIALPEVGENFHVKAKPIPPGQYDGWNSSPRKEIAAYQIQLLFLDPIDFVVPTSTMRCVRLDVWNEKFPETQPSVPGTQCVLVNLSMWLNDLTVPDVVYDEQRFLEDANYAYRLAQFNLVTYLIKSRDLRSGNILVSKHDADRRVFAIDNGITFGAWFYNWANRSSYTWQRITVPALPRATVDRLRALQRQDLDVLATVVQFKPDESERLVRVKPGPPFDPDEGVRLDGTRLQFGLTRGEIDDVWERIEDLLKAVDKGRIGLF
jgi:hypothetical protein